MNILSERGLPAEAGDCSTASASSYGQHLGQRDRDADDVDANYGGPMYSASQTYGKAPMMLSMLGGIVGDSAVQRAMSNYARTWRFKHPSPWDFMFVMNRELKQDLGWFWYYWLFTTESVGRLDRVGERRRAARRRSRCGRTGEMPSPVVLRVEFAAERPGAQADEERGHRRRTSPRSPGRWTSGSAGAGPSWRSWTSAGGRSRRSSLDPERRFPDRDPADNIWPAAATGQAPAAAPTSPH